MLRLWRARHSSLRMTRYAVWHESHMIPVCVVRTETYRGHCRRLSHQRHGFSPLLPVRGRGVIYCVIGRALRNIVVADAPASATLGGSPRALSLGLSAPLWLAAARALLSAGGVHSASAAPLWASSVAVALGDDSAAVAARLVQLCG